VRQVLACPRLRVRGVLGYEGHATDEPDGARRGELVAAAMDRLGAASGAVRELVPDAAVVSAGGTGTFDLTGADRRVSEIQPGTYVLMDVFHQEVTPQFDVAHRHGRRADPARRPGRGGRRPAR
jgi:D-serine deaminase-like pyridoxal phosphate-dependent protein